MLRPVSWFGQIIPKDKPPAPLEPNPQTQRHPRMMMMSVRVSEKINDPVVVLPISYARKYRALSLTYTTDFKNLLWWHTAARYAPL